MNYKRRWTPRRGLSQIVNPGDAGLERIGFGLLCLAAGETYTAAAEEKETALILLGGTGTVRGEGFAYEDIGQRKDVFSGKAASVYLPAGSSSYDAVKNDYSAIGLDLGGIEVLHATEYLDRLLNKAKISPRDASNRIVTLQDSDCLCRFNAVCRQPRRVLQGIPGVQLKEMPWTRDKAYSCGEAGGVLPLLYPELSGKLAKLVLQQAAGPGWRILNFVSFSDFPCFPLLTAVGQLIS